MLHQRTQLSSFWLIGSCVSLPAFTEPLMSSDAGFLASLLVQTAMRREHGGRTAGAGTFLSPAELLPGLSMSGRKHCKIISTHFLFDGRRGRKRAGPGEIKASAARICGCSEGPGKETAASPHRGRARGCGLTDASRACVVQGWQCQWWRELLETQRSAA